MSELLKLIQDGDLAGLAMEQAREAVEQAKTALEIAKERFEQARGEFDQVIARADDVGLPRAKLKKIVEERTAALWTSGLVGSTDERLKAPKVARAARKSKTEAASGPDAAGENETEFVEAELTA